MDKESSVLAIIGNEVDPAPYHQVAQLLGYNQANIVVGGANDGAEFIRSSGYSPKYLILDIGNACFACVYSIPICVSMDSIQYHFPTQWQSDC